MKNSLFIIALFVLVKTNAQTAEFKKAYDEGNMKLKIKSYTPAIQSYDKAIALVQTDADNAFKSKTILTDDKKYIADAYAKRSSCYYYTGNYNAMKTDAEKTLALDPKNPDAVSLLAYMQYKAGTKKKACISEREQINKGSETAKKIFEDCSCAKEGIAIYKEGVTQANLKRYDTALVRLNEALVILPDSGSIYV